MNRAILLVKEFTGNSLFTKLALTFSGQQTFNRCKGVHMLLFYLSMIDSPEDLAKFEALYEDYYKLLISVAYEMDRTRKTRCIMRI